MKINFASIYFKSTIIVVVSCGILAAIVSFLGDRASREIAAGGIQRLAWIENAVIADQLFGPIRFRKTEDAELVVEGAMRATDFLQSVLVFDKDGALLSKTGGPAENAAAAADLARSALRKGTPDFSQDGLTVAHPIRKDSDAESVGAVVSNWTTAPLEQTLTKYRRQQIVGAGLAVLLLALVSGIATRQVVAAPVDRIRRRAEAMALNDLESETPGTSGRSEVGRLAKAMEALRHALCAAEVDRQTALLRSSGFMAYSSAALMVDRNLTVTFNNHAFVSLMGQVTDYFRTIRPDFDPCDMIGKSADLFLDEDADDAGTLASAIFPLVRDIQANDSILQVSVVPIENESGARDGYVMEFKDVSEIRRTAAILSALEAGQVRADFNAQGELLASNDRFDAIVAGQSIDLTSTISREDGSRLWSELEAGTAHLGRFVLDIGGRSRIVSGSVNPIHGSDGSIHSFVLMGEDVTEEVARLTAANDQNARMAAIQVKISAEMKRAMTALSKGDLKFRITERFGAENDSLRNDFNSAVSALDAAIGTFMESAHTIRSEAENISGAADAFSMRTEQQAATLEETAAAITELSASVESAAQRAKQANAIVSKAREAAASSGTLVQDTVAAMGEIEHSSEQISRIIGVIDEIAFQTNLLALNAGVEAARAGDAGRGFAVVASEVRALAQRSSEAAREISDLISASGEHVKKGVSLVDKAGDALTGIASTIGTVAENVSDIAASAHEQAFGVSEINEAMGRLDQVTQQNVAMFEETMAASVALNEQATELVAITGEFSCSPKGQIRTAPYGAPAKAQQARQYAKSPEDVPATLREVPSELQGVAARTAAPQTLPRSAAGGNLAVQPAGCEDEWEEF